MRLNTAIKTFLIACVVFAANARADPQADARALKEESLKILKASADRDATPDEMAKCIFNLEKAAKVLEDAHDTESDLALEVNSELYWARKRSTLAIDAALDKLRGVAGVAKPAPKKSEPVKTSVAADPNGPPDMQGVEDARKAFQEAERVARSHGNDDYVISLHWFQLASLHPGTDYSLKALTFAREAQQRFSAGNPNAKKEEIPDTPEMKPVREGDAMAIAKNFENAIPLYQASLKIKESLIAHRRLGQAYYGRAQQVKDVVEPKCRAAGDRVIAAAKNAYMTVRTFGGGSRRVFNPNDPTYAAAYKDWQAAYKECDAAFALYDKASAEFKSVLHMAPGGRSDRGGPHRNLHEPALRKPHQRETVPRKIHERLHARQRR